MRPLQVQLDSVIRDVEEMKMRECNEEEDNEMEQESAAATAEKRKAKQGGASPERKKPHTV